MFLYFFDDEINTCQHWYPEMIAAHTKKFDWSMDYRSTIIKVINEFAKLCASHAF